MSSILLPPRPGPFIQTQRGVPDLMQDVLLALCPGALVFAILFGPAVFFQIILGVLGAITAESAILWLRQRPVMESLRDRSAVLTGVLLALSIPPWLPGWMTWVGASLAIVIGKQIYGGLGQNPFNPAMVGYAFLMLAFPHDMTLWPGTLMDLPSASLGLGNAWTFLFQDGSALVDGLSRATPLTTRHESWRGINSLPVHWGLGAWGWMLLNAAYLCGGLWLIHRKVADLRIALGLILGLVAGSLILTIMGSASLSSLLETLFMGSTMLGAFFIATDPVTAPASPRGRWIYGVTIGLLVLLIRRYGNYPDGMAFAILIMNFAVPTIDRYTRPRTFGHT